MSITASIRRGLGFQALVLFVAACADPFGAQSGGQRQVRTRTASR